MNNLRTLFCLPVLMVLVSVVVGWGSFIQTRDEMKADLNQALQTLVDNEDEGVLDSLSTISGSPMLTFNGEYNGFARMLRITSLRDTACISYAVVSNDATGNATRMPDGVVCSDSLTISGNDARFYVRAYASPSVASFLAYPGMMFSTVSFVLGILFLLLNVRKLYSIKVLGADNLEVYAEEPYADVSALTLTPMQEQLLQLFLQSPERTLSKDRICSALWPKKDNPDDTFYTFISRMKSALAKQSTLKIENKRGGGYVLYDESKENAL